MFSLLLFAYCNYTPDPVIFPSLNTIFSFRTMSISLQQKNPNTVPSDCVICATRPVLYVNQINIYQARFYCYHRKPESRPHFRTSVILKSVTILCNVLLIYGIVNDFNQIEGRFNAKQVVIFIEMSYNFSTIIINIIFLLKNWIKLRESHGLITLINNKVKYGVEVILTSHTAKRLRNMFMVMVIGLTVEEIIMFFVELTMENVTNELFVRMIMIEIFILSNASLGLYCIQFLFMYEYMFDQCFNEIEKFLNELPANYFRVFENSQQNVISGLTLFEQLQKLQRLYMSLRRNFKLNETFLQPGVIIIHCVNICFLLIGYVYFSVMFFEGEAVLLKFDIYLILKSSALVVAFCFLCYQAQKVAVMSQDILSFLFKCPISKLNKLESAQVEMLIATLTIQKPEVKVSDIFTIGTGLLASISGAVLTYVLVALQFHAIWSTK
nr:PREDICTED: uncharacterized protein LOC103312264 isoform X2 [Tribolium castaneum]|eukprot:XP_008190686.2 PREDICTED: uncharacterized protein LOC103312264 isoform X2 [Tribolium castaneum]